MMKHRIASALIGLVAMAGSAAAGSRPTDEGADHHGVPLGRLAPASSAPASTSGDAFGAEIAASKTTMMATPEVALAHARRATFLAGQRASPDAGLRRLTATWLEGEALVRLQKPELALAILGPAVDSVGRSAADTKLNGDLLKARGHAYRALGRVQPALSDYQSALGIFQRSKDPRSQAIILQAIASVYRQARDDAQALKYYAQSEETYAADDRLSLTSHNNRGMVLRDTGRLREAQAQFAKALGIAGKLHSGNLSAPILTNMATTEILAGDLSEAKTTIQRGLALSEHDGEARSERPFLLGAAAKVALASGDAAGATRLLDQAFQGVDVTRTAMEFRDVHETAAKAYEDVGDRAKALAHLKAFKRLDDSSRSLAASASAALVAARFDFANQNLRIARLKEGQLERDVRLARSQARLRAVIVSTLAGAGVVLFLMTLVGFLYMRRSRDRIRNARDQLALSNASLERALNAKTEFLATTSHEIRTPLNGILGMTQVILADSGIDGALRDRVSLVHAAGETMKTLVDDILDVAKAESDALVIEHETFSLQRTITQTQEFWSARAASKGLPLTLEMQVPELAIGDGGRLRQVLSNLLSNAIKFTDEGGVDLHASHQEGWLVLRVADTGVGIDPVDQDRIFEPFMQADSSKSRRFGGTGLGLSICRNIVSAMGGRIGVESRPGAGASFTVRVPLDIAAGPAANPQLVEETAAAGVLILDPNPLNRSMLKAALSPHYDPVTSTGRLDEALSELGTSSVQAIVADAAGLGGEDVRPEALTRLAAASAGARLLLLCSESDVAALTAVAAHTGADLLVKPVAVTRLVEHLAGRPADGPPAAVRAA